MAIFMERVYHLWSNWPNRQVFFAKHTATSVAATAVNLCLPGLFLVPSVICKVPIDLSSNNFGYC